MSFLKSPNPPFSSPNIKLYWLSIFSYSWFPPLVKQSPQKKNDWIEIHFLSPTSTGKTYALEMRNREARGGVRTVSAAAAARLDRVLRRDAHENRCTLVRPHPWGGIGTPHPHTDTGPAPAVLSWTRGSLVERPWKDGVVASGGGGVAGGRWRGAARRGLGLGGLAGTGAESKWRKAG